MLTKRARFYRHFYPAWAPFLFFSAYTTFLLLYISHLPLWTDELVDMSQTKQFELQLIAHNVPADPGGVPLGYFIQGLSLKLFGISAFAARLPPLVFGVAACIVVLFLAKELGVHHPLIAVSLFALFPIVVRYDLEARPYSQALFFGTLSTLFLVHYLRKPSIRGVVPILLSTALGLYSQPYSFLPVAAQTLSTQREWRRFPNRRTLTIVVALAIALLLFLPWLVYAHSQWKVDIDTHVSSPGISWKSPLLIFKDLLGAGYLGTALITGLCLFGLRSPAALRTKRLLLASILISILLVILTDAASGYFLAIRQMIFILPAVAILAAFGLEVLFESRRRISAVLFLSAVLLTQSIAIKNWLDRPRGDWNIAAQTIAKARTQYQCIVFVPDESAKYIGIFNPSLAAHACSPVQLTTAASLAIVSSATADAQTAQVAVTVARSRGLAHRSVLIASDPSVQILSR